MQRSGIALVATLVILVMVSLLVFGTHYTTQIESWVTRNDSTSTTANYIAQAGLQKYKTALFQSYRWTLQNTVITSNDACQNVLAVGIDFDRDGPGTTQTYPIYFTEPIGGGEAAVTIDRDDANPRYMIITSVGSYGTAKSTVRAVFNLSNAGLFSYAIVSGAGGGVGFVNGSVSISGGVFIEGATSNSNDPAANPVFIGSGNMQVTNGYNLNTANSVAVGALNDSNTWRISPRVVSNLCASFRVRYGAIRMGGSATLGTSANQLVDIKVGDSSWVPSAGTKALAYTTGGNPQLIQNQNCSNGFCAPFIGRYDLSNANSPDFPTLTTSVNCSATGTTITWRACMVADARVEFVQGSTTLPALPAEVGATWDWNPGNNCLAALGNPVTTITLSNTAIDCRFRRNGTVVGGFNYTPSGSDGQLQVFGTVALRGFDLTTTRKIYYTASPSFGQTNQAASLFVQNSGGVSPVRGNITLGGDLLPDSTTTFPQQTLALLAEGNGADTNTALAFSSNNLTVAALLYTPRRLVSSGAQTVIAGMIIADSFCSSSNCNGGGSAQIYHVNPQFNLPATLQPLLNNNGGNVATFQIYSYERY